MADVESLDAVFVDTARPTTVRCRASCVNTLSEKPPGMSVTETTALRDTAARTGATSKVSWNRPVYPSIVKAQEVVEAQGAGNTASGGVPQKYGQGHQIRSLSRIIDGQSVSGNGHTCAHIVRAIAGGRG